MAAKFTYRGTLNKRALKLLTAAIVGVVFMEQALAEDGEKANTLVQEVAPAKSTPIATIQIPLEAIDVVGNRASIASAIQIKREANEIVDAVVADDINKLPDYNLSDAIQRVTGVQIARDRGEGSVIAIRGLTQVETTLNGREIFTAGNGRTLDYADIPSEMVAAINVYKTSSAQHIEGGIGGLVDLRTRRPFDFKEPQLVLTGRAIYGDFVQETKPQISLLATDKWAIGGGEFGALVNFAYQERAWREDQDSFGNPLLINAGGRLGTAPNGFSRTVTLGERERIAGSVVLEWQLSDRLAAYAELHHAQFKTWQNGYQLFVTATGAFDPSSVSLAGNSAQTITWNTLNISNQGSGRDTIDRTTQVAIGGSWSGDALTLKADLSHTKSFNNLDFLAITYNGTAASLAQNVAAGSNQLNAPSFTTIGATYAKRPLNGELTAWQLDGTYERVGQLFDSVSAGVRYAERDATSAPGQVVCAFNTPSCLWPNVPAAGAISLLTSTSYSDYLIGNPSIARDVAAVRNALGIINPPITSNPLGTWTIEENTLSGYLMATIQADVLPIDGNIGVRLIKTQNQIDGFRNNPLVAGTFLPVVFNQSYTDALPSANLRWTLAEGLYLRTAASKTLTRPDFNQMSPSLSLNSVQFTGTAGNPSLRPIRADNYDIALEKYINKTTSVYLTGFRKTVDGFLTNVTSLETYDGITYQVTRPYNTDVAHIKGAEIGYQQFYDFLPGWLSGLGLQANYTYVDSELPNQAIGAKIPLQNLSKNSYNLVGMYEKDKLSVRVAYNWRDKFLTGVQNVTGVGALPIYTKAYGWLDASLRYRATRQITLGLEGLNLLDTERKSYYGVETRPQTKWKNDKQLSATVTVNF